MKETKLVGFLTFVILFCFQCGPEDKKDKIEALNKKWQAAVMEIRGIEAEIYDLKQEWKEKFDEMKLDKELLDGLSIEMNNKLTYQTDQYINLGGEVKKLEDNYKAYYRGIEAQAESFEELTRRFLNDERVMSLEVRVRKADEDIKKVKAAKTTYQSTIAQIREAYTEQFENFHETLKE